MREYKFRAWDNHDQCWLNSFAIFYNGEFADMAKGVMQGDICQCDINYQKTPSHIIIEQFTGLHDKNGKEIYEGDVVKVRKISIDDKLYEAKVLFQQIGRSGFAYSIDYKDDNGTLFYGLQEQKYIEVIGNIHEETEHERV